MSKKPKDKLALKRQAWLERSMLALDTPEADTLAMLDTPRCQSLRINPLKADREQTLAALGALGWEGKPYAWAADGYTIDTGLEAVRDSTLTAEGRVFIQNAASWLPVISLEPRPGERVLDICAAPGGKSSHIAALTNNQAELWVNDNSRPRLAKMRANFERLGVIPAEMTLYDAVQLSRRLDGRQFDKILLDAPCSGEGLMCYSVDKDFATWSVAHIKRLQHLQKQLILQAWRLLKPGGTLVYSTCTMAPEENEAVVDYLLRTQLDARLEPIALDLPGRVPAVAVWNDKPCASAVAGCLRMKPTPQVEAFFVAKLHKADGVV